MCEKSKVDLILRNIENYRIVFCEGDIEIFEDPTGMNKDEDRHFIDIVHIWNLIKESDEIFEEEKRLELMDSIMESINNQIDCLQEVKRQIYGIELE